jgi:hypothetical protein
MNGSEKIEGVARVYRVNTLHRVAGVIVSAAGIFFMIAIWGGVIAGTRDPNLWEMLGIFAFVVVALLFTISAYMDLVYLSQSSIELRTIYGRKRLPLDRIRGRRRYLVPGDADSPDTWHLKLEPNDDRFPILDFEENYNFDDFFKAWFYRLPDLDELDKLRPKTSNFGLV